MVCSVWVSLVSTWGHIALIPIKLCNQAERPRVSSSLTCSMHHSYPPKLNKLQNRSVKEWQASMYTDRRKRPLRSRTWNHALTQVFCSPGWETALLERVHVNKIPLSVHLQHIKHLKTPSLCLPLQRQRSQTLELSEMLMELNIILNSSVMTWQHVMCWDFMLDISISLYWCEVINDGQARTHWFTCADQKTPSLSINWAQWHWQEASKCMLKLLLILHEMYDKKYCWWNQP